jgi:lipoprotein signal peptidase
MTTSSSLLRRTTFAGLIFGLVLVLDWGSKFWALHYLPSLLTMRSAVRPTSGPFLAWALNSNLEGGLSILRPLSGILLVGCLGASLLFLNWGRGLLPLIGVGLLWANLAGNGLEMAWTGNVIDFLGLVLPSRQLLIVNLADLTALATFACLGLCSIWPSRFGWVEQVDFSWPSRPSR